MAESFKYTNNKGHAGELHQKASKEHPIMTTAQGCPISDNQKDRKSGV